MARPIIIDAQRETYSKEDVRTMTVGELIELLQEFDEDRPVILSHDRGYTYGGIRWSNIYDEEVADDD